MPRKSTILFVVGCLLLTLFSVQTANARSGRFGNEPRGFGHDVIPFGKNDSQPIAVLEMVSAPLQLTKPVWISSGLIKTVEGIPLIDTKGTISIGSVCSFTSGAIINSGSSTLALYAPPLATEDQEALTLTNGGILNLCNDASICWSDSQGSLSLEGDSTVTVDSDTSSVIVTGYLWTASGFQEIPFDITDLMNDIASGNLLLTQPAYGDVTVQWTGASGLDPAQPTGDDYAGSAPIYLIDSASGGGRDMSAVGVPEPSMLSLLGLLALGNLTLVGRRSFRSGR